VKKIQDRAHLGSAGEDTQCYFHVGMDLRINISHVRIEIDTCTSASLVATELKTLNGPGIWENVLIVLGMDWRLSDAEAVFSTFPETCLIPSKSALAFASVKFTSFGSGCSD
jgi:hypothetical protein